MKRSFAALAFALASGPVVALAQEPAEAPPAAELPRDPSPSPPPLQPDPAPVVPAPHASPATPTPPPLYQGAEPDSPRVEGPARTDWIRIGAGVRVGYVPDAAFDTYSTNDALPQFSLDGTITLLSGKKASFATGLAWDVGGRSNGLRGLDASLTVHRLTVPLEGRYHFGSGVYAFGRLAPGAAVLFSRIDDPSSSGAKLKDSSWVFAGDVSVGASILVGPRTDLDRRTPHVWITPEVGWSLMTSADLRPTPAKDESDVLGRDAGTNLGSAALGGFFWKASVATTF